MKYHPQFITLRVKSYAIIREIIGKEQIILHLPRKDGGKFQKKLKRRLQKGIVLIMRLVQSLQCNLGMNAKLAIHIVA